MKQAIPERANVVCGLQLMFVPVWIFIEISLMNNDEIANAICFDEDKRLGKLFKSTLNNRLHRNLACVIDKNSRGAKLERAFEELP